MINFRHITLASNFYTTKFSANRQNTEYTVGNRTDRIVQGTPSVLYDEVVFCKELKIIYTHGAFYEANSAQFDLDGFVTKGELIDNYVNKTDLDNYYTKPQTDNTFVKKSTLENNYYDKDTTFDLFVTKNRLITDYLNKSDIEENYYTKRQTNNLLDQKQDIISGEGVISVEDNVVKADLSDYYNKSEVYTKQETDNLLDQKQDIISGEGVISVENNVVSADLSDYYNKETVDDKLDTKQNLISGNPGEVLYHNGSDVFTQEVLGENLVVTTQTDLDKCKNISPSFKTVLESWQRFSHLNGVNNAKPADLSGWEYLEDLNTVRQNNNSESYAGFISPKSYSNYELTIRVFSDDTVVNDDDSIGLVAAFAKDSNGREHTLSFIRSIGTSNNSTGKTSIRWVCVLDYCAFALDSTANGQKILANNSTAVPTAPGVVKWADVPTGSVIYVKREGNVFTAKCSNFNSRTLVEESTMTINLDTLTENGQNPTLNLFKGSSPWGYSTFSQAHSMYENISVVDPSFVIFDLVNSAVLTFDSATSSWLPVAGQNPIELLGAGRFSYNNVTNKLFYNNGTSVVELASKYYAGNNIKIEDNTISAAISSEDIDIDLSDYYNKTEINTKFSNLATVASTGSYNDLTNKPQLQNLTAGENIEINNSVISAVDTKYTAGEGIEIDEDNKISLVQQDTVTETPVDTDDVNIFYNYNGVKVVVPEGKGYFNLLHDYIIPDAADGDQIFPKGLYIEGDATLAPDNVVEFNFIIFGGVKYSIELSTELLSAMTDAGYTESQTKSYINSYFNSELSENSVFAKSITKVFSDELELAVLPIATDLGLSNAYSGLYHYKVEPEYQILRLNDYYIDIFGNVYKITNITSEEDTSYIARADVVYNFNYKLIHETRTSIPITLISRKSGYTDSAVQIIERFIGSQIGTLKLVKDTSGSSDKIIIRYLDGGRSKYVGTFKSTYKNEGNQLCYVYSYGNSDLAMTFRKVKLYKTGPFVKRLTFCGFVTIGSDYSVEIPIQYTTDTTELQGFSWTNKESTFDSSFSNTSINAVQNKVITGELAKLRTEFVPHLTELPFSYDENAIVQYIGESTDLFTNGYFYKFTNIVVPPNTYYINLKNEYPKFNKGIYIEVEKPENFPALGVVQVSTYMSDFYTGYTIASGQESYGTISQFPGIRFDFFGVPTKNDTSEFRYVAEYIQAGDLAADEAGNLFMISEVYPRDYPSGKVKVKLNVYKVAYDFILESESQPDTTFHLSEVLTQLLSDEWIEINLRDSTATTYDLFKTFTNYRGDTVYMYKYGSDQINPNTGLRYCCTTKLVNGNIKPTFAGFLDWSNFVRTVYIESGEVGVKPTVYRSGNSSYTTDVFGWIRTNVQPSNEGGVISYNDLIDKPTIPQVDDALSDSSSNAVENRVIKSAIDDKITNGGGVTTEIALTKAEYNSIPTKDDNTVYIITDEPVEERANVFKVCIVTSDIINISSLVQQHSLIPNNVIILTGMDDSKTYEYTLDGSTKTFKGDSDHDLMFRYIGNNEFKPIVFGAL